MPIGELPKGPESIRLEKLKSEIEELRIYVESFTVDEIELMDADEKSAYFEKKRKLRWKEREAEKTRRMAIIMDKKRNTDRAEAIARKQRIAHNRERGIYWAAGNNMAVLQRQVQQESMRRFFNR